MCSAFKYMIFVIFFVIHFDDDKDFLLNLGMIIRNNYFSQ